MESKLVRNIPPQTHHCLEQVAQVGLKDQAAVR